MSIVYTRSMILGIDEAGRGPWAGPLVVGAVVLGTAEIVGLDDSKKLTKKRREALEVEILEKAAAYGLGWVRARELDEIGMSAALRLATKRAVEQIRVSYHEIIIDGTVNFLAGTTKGEYVKTFPKADALFPSVSAASILAKVARDRYMTALSETYPEYKFAANAGYGVAAHREAIARIGVCPEHRLSFAPLQQYRTARGEMAADEGETIDSLDAQQKKLFSEKAAPTTRAVGNESETVAANYLISLGHEIIERNWRTKWCEIDIVSKKADTVYFTEVKHRRNDKGGDGFAAITKKKQHQMAFAARLFAHRHQLEGVCDLRLAALATAGEHPVVTQFVEII